VPAVELGTRERLLIAARELIEEGGYGAASVVAIAERAGLGTGTLYRHFPSKAELFAQLFREVCDLEIVAMEAAGAEARDHVERLELVLATFAARALHNRRLAWALLAEPVDPLVDVERLAYRRRYADLMAHGLGEGIAAGEIPDQDADLTAAALVGGTGEALVGPLSPVATSAPPVDELVAALRTFTRRAIGA